MKWRYRWENVDRKYQTFLQEKKQMWTVSLKNTSGAAAEHAACLVISSLVAAVLIVGTGEMVKKKHDSAGY